MKTAKRILIIDDDEDILDILNIILQDVGFEVIVSNTAEAAEHLSEILPDLILLDIRILGAKQTGDQICADIKKVYPNKPPVLLFSAEENASELAKNCNADGLIKKPFDIEHLVYTVKEVVCDE